MTKRYDQFSGELIYQFDNKSVYRNNNKVRTPNSTIILILILILLFIPSFISAQISISSDGSKPDPSAMLDVKSSSKGLLIPRVSDTSDVTVKSDGLLVYKNTGGKGFYYFDSEKGWIALQPKVTFNAANNICNSDSKGNTRYNTTDNRLEVCTGTEWEVIGSQIDTLVVEGELKLGNTNKVCDASTEGSLRYNSGKMEICSTGSWSEVGTNSNGNNLSMIEKWPDVIRCSDGSFDSYFYLNGNSTQSITYLHTSYNIKYHHSSGDFESASTASLGASCQNKNISEVISDGAGFFIAGGSSKGGASSFQELTDATISETPADNSFLRYNSTSGKWEETELNKALGTTSMISGWPDAIYCKSATRNDLLYYTLTENNDVYYIPPYSNPGSSEAYFIIFNKNTKEYDRNTGMTSLANYDCIANTKSISQLYADGQAFNFIGNSSGNGWEDMDLSDTSPFDITCEYKMTIDGSSYLYPVNLSANSMLFDISTASFNFGKINAVNKNVWVIAAEGNVASESAGGNISKIKRRCSVATGSGASSFQELTDATISETPADNSLLRYNSISGKWEETELNKALGTTSMVPGWPDAIKCNVTNPNWGARILYLNDAPFENGTFYYAEPFSKSDDYRVIFNANKTFNSASYTTHTCNKSIDDLYASGQAFNLLGGIDNTPIGTVQSFAGLPDKVPTGWLICDGRELNRSDYSTLYDIISNSWGEGDGSTTFNIPDLRGQFLRGVDTGAAKDPDAASRTAIKTGGNTGDNVGSIQDDQYKSHSHSPNKGSSILEGGGNGGLESFNFSGGPNSSQSSTASSGGSETRPKNAYVYFIIKAFHTNSGGATTPQTGQASLVASTDDCTSSNEGAIRYNSTIKKMQFCDGGSWNAFDSKSEIKLFTNTYYWSNGSYAKSCKEYLDNSSNTPLSGVYYIDPDGNDNSNPEFKAYCDMTTDGGGWTLLAHYKDGWYPPSETFDITTNFEITGANSGAVAANNWHPNLSDKYGHLDYSKFTPNNREVKLTCGATGNENSYTSSSLFTNFNTETKGVYGTSGNPGWAIIADKNSSSREDHYICGASTNTPGYSGIGYCSGTGTAGAWGNHKASYSTNHNVGKVGCNGTTYQYLRVWIK